MRVFVSVLILSTFFASPGFSQHGEANERALAFHSLLERFGEPASVAARVLDPQPLLDGVEVSPVGSVPGIPTRIARDPVDGNLYIATMDGAIFRMHLDGSTPLVERVYDTGDHGLSEHVLGMNFAPNGDLYVLSNIESNTHLNTHIRRGVRTGPTGDERDWESFAQTDPYLRSRTAFDHKASALVVSPDGQYVYYNSGSRTDHGEEHEGTREEGLTAVILRIPTATSDHQLPNDRSALREAGYLFAEGTRNHFDLAFAPNGDLFGTENSGDRDDSEEINWLREGHHYGFPWRIGSSNTPQQFPGYVREQDRLVSRRATAWNFFYDDPGYPEPPEGVVFTDPIRNVGPDADRYRDPATGNILDASETGAEMRTLTAHRSPLGLVFDVDNALAGPLTGDGFFLSWTGTSSNLLNGMGDEGEDLHHLELTKVGDEYEARITRIARGFRAPIDAVLVGSDLYVLEYGSMSVWKVALPATTTATESSEQPVALSLDQNYPNPFNPSARISFELPHSAPVRLIVVDALGREVLRPIDGVLAAGRHSADVNLVGAPSGVYLYRLEASGEVRTRRMVLAK